MLDTYKQISDLQHEALVQLEKLIMTLEELDDLTKTDLTIKEEWLFKDLLKEINITDLYYKHTVLHKLGDLHGFSLLDEGSEECE